MRCIVLDAGGVLVTDAFKTTLAEFAQANGQEPAAVLGEWERQLRQPLWDGTLQEEDFWPMLMRIAHSNDDPTIWRQKMIAALQPTAWADDIPLGEWAQQASICVFSNHRANWLCPVLQEHNMDHWFAEIWVSDLIGMVKPDFMAYAWLRQQFPEGTLFCYADDQQRNLTASQSSGFHPVHVQPDNDWIQQINDWLATTSTPVIEL